MFSKANTQENKMNKKIVFSSNASWYLWNFRRNLMESLKKDGYEIITTSSRDDYSDKLVREFPWVQVRNLERTGMSPFRDLVLILEYIRIYRNLKPDLVLNFTIKPNIYSSIACFVLRIPVISTVTGLGYSFLKQGLLHQIVLFLYRIAFFLNKKVVFQNEDDKKFFLKSHVVRHSQAVLIEGSGIDTVRFNKIPEIHPVVKDTARSFTFLMVVRLLHDKGIMEFAEAAQKVAAKYPKIRFVIMGGQDKKNPACITDEELERLKLQGIECVGELIDVVPVLRQADAAVLPSYREGLSKSLVEAMGVELPIITTDIAGCRSLVQEGVNGFLVPPKDGESLAHAMIRMVELSQEVRMEMGKASRALVLERFDQRIIIEDYKKLIQEIVG
jgi:glycosyltransferase involved in cell wall biosynthesis